MRRVLTGCLGAALLTAPLLHAQGGIEYETYEMPNGLRVVLSEDHSTPIVTVSVWYDVGSANEETGRSGFAHLFEHMMFQGSENLGTREHSNSIARAGGTVNGTTNEDRTNYFETLPSNRLNLGLWLEADRMRSLAVTVENFENQREVVKEERRMRVDNQPYAPAFSEGVTLLFDSTDCFPYSHSVIGSMADLDAGEVEDVQAFFDLYYAPNNATLTLVGDFDPAEAKSLVDQYFGDIPRGAEPPSIMCNARFDAGAREKLWEDKLANLPGVITIYLVPEHDHEDTRALQLLSTIMGTGESARLNKSLVREQQSAVVGIAQMASRRGPGFFIAGAIANQGFGADDLRAQIGAEMETLRVEGVTEQELQKAKNAFKASDIFGKQTTFAVAEALQHYALYHDSIDDMDTDLGLYMDVTIDDMMRVAQKYLTPQNSLTLIIVPAGTGGTP